MEIVLTMETVPDEYDDNEGIVPSNHGTPAAANNAPMATATNTATTATVQQAHVHILREMKCLKGWFNPTALKYIAQSNKNGKLDVILSCTFRSEIPVFWLFRSDSGFLPEFLPVLEECGRKQSVIL